MDQETAIHFLINHTQRWLQWMFAKNALFIARRTYPIAYDKWIREQVADILNLPDLYSRLVHLLEIKRLESDELIQKAKTIETWIEATIEKS